MLYKKRKNFKYSFYYYIIVSVLWIIYFNFFFNDINESWAQLSVQWIQILPYLILSLLIFVITMYIDKFK
jgi:polyferredoxin